jgi:hypothetical protein
MFAMGLWILRAPAAGPGGFDGGTRWKIRDDRVGSIAAFQVGIAALEYRRVTWGPSPSRDVRAVVDR